MSTQQPPDAERGARLVGELLKAWPAKEAALPVHIACCEELRLVIAPWVNGDGQAAKWFAQLDRELGQRLKSLRHLAAQATREADKTRRRWQLVADQAPAGLQRALRQARR